jgi:hypothetical protein
MAAFGGKLSKPLEEWLTPTETQGLEAQGLRLERGEKIAKGGAGDTREGERGSSGGGGAGCVGRVAAVGSIEGGGGRGKIKGERGGKVPDKTLPDKTLLEYARNGHVKLPNLLQQLKLDPDEVYEAFETVFD